MEIPPDDADAFDLNYSRQIAADAAQAQGLPLPHDVFEDLVAAHKPPAAKKPAAKRKPVGTTPTYKASTLPPTRTGAPAARTGPAVGRTLPVKMVEPQKKRL